MFQIYLKRIFQREIKILGTFQQLNTNNISTFKFNYWKLFLSINSKT